VSSNALRSLARLSRPWAVKKLMALSRAELTFLPVANRVWVRSIRFEVCCNCSRFDRTPADRTMSDISGTFLVYLPYWQLHVSIPWIGKFIAQAPPTARKSSWLMSYHAKRGKFRTSPHQNIAQRSAPRAIVMVSETLRVKLY